VGSWSKWHNHHHCGHLQLLDLIFVLRTVGSLVYNARNTHLGVWAFSKPVFKIATSTLEWVCGFFTAVWSSNYFGLPHDCEGQEYVLLWVVRKTPFLIGEVLAMMSTAVKLQTTNVLSLQYSILSEPCNVNLYGLIQHTTCFTTWAKVLFGVKQIPEEQLLFNKGQLSALHICIFLSYTY